MLVVEGHVCNDGRDEGGRVCRASPHSAQATGRPGNDRPMLLDTRWEWWRRRSKMRSEQGHRKIYVKKREREDKTNDEEGKEDSTNKEEKVSVITEREMGQKGQKHEGVSQPSSLPRPC